MNERRRCVSWWALGVVCVVAFSIARVGAQTQAPTHGQNVQPAYEGWTRNANGTFTLYFGYMNRNLVEEPNVAVGADNGFEPGPPDRGQPAHFYPRRQQFVFAVTVPADWGDKKLVWSVTHNGRTDRAVGKLTSLWALDPGVWFANRVGNSAIGNREFATQQPPSTEIVGADQVTATVSDGVSLAVAVKDDGLPGPADDRIQLGARENRLRAAPIRTVQTDETGASVASNQSGPPTQDIVTADSAAKTGLALTWLHYRGPGKVTFEPMITPLNKLGGEARTQARFSQPGTYVLRAVADDGMLTTPVTVTVTVK